MAKTAQSERLEAEPACQPNVSASASESFVPHEEPTMEIRASSRFESPAEFALWTDCCRTLMLKVQDPLLPCPSVRLRLLRHLKWLSPELPPALVARAVLLGDRDAPECTSTGRQLVARRSCPSL